MAHYSWTDREISQLRALAKAAGLDLGGGGGGAVDDPARSWKFVSAELALSEAGDLQAVVVATPPADPIAAALYSRFNALVVVPGNPTPVNLCQGGQPAQVTAVGDGNVRIVSKNIYVPAGTYDVYCFGTSAAGAPITSVEYGNTITVGNVDFPRPEITNTWAPSQIAAEDGDYPSIARAVSTLTVWEGRIYASYGDMNTNAGPIDVLALDPAHPELGFVSEATLTTEQLGPFRAFGDKLYAPFLDPQGGIGNPENGMYAWRSADDPTWHTVPNTTPYLEHCMDVAVTSDGDIFVCGLAELEDGDGTDYGVVLRSTDDGATWEPSYQSSTASTSQWLYRLFIFGDELVIGDAASAVWMQLNGDYWTVCNALQNRVGAPIATGALHFPIKFTVNSDAQAAITAPVDIYNYTMRMWIGSLDQDQGGPSNLSSTLANYTMQFALDFFELGSPCVDQATGRFYMNYADHLFSFPPDEPSSNVHLVYQMPSITSAWGDVSPSCYAVHDGVLYWGNYDGTICSAPVR